MTDVPKNTELLTRVKSAIVMLTLAFGAVYAGGWVFMAFAGVVAAIALWEWKALSEKLATSALSATLWTISGMLYIGVAVACLIFVRDRGGIDGVVAIIGVVVATDIGAYFTGRTFGGPKIAPAISPSKTWSGLLGGMVAAGLFFVFLWSAVSQTPMWAAGPIGAFLAIVAQAGDFLESYMKRKAGVKDSGSLIPGHGGVLDRVDGMLPVAIVATLGTLILMSQIRF